MILEESKTKTMIISGTKLEGKFLGLKMNA